jgi:hypothetical protein
MIPRQLERPQRGDEVEGRFRVAVEAPGERGPEVIVVEVQPPKPEILLRAGQLRNGPLGQREVIGGVARAGGIEVGPAVRRSRA